LNFVGFPFKTSKFKNDINYIKYKFLHRFGKVCKWLNMYYSKIKIIILKNIWIYRECNFFHYWATVLCIHPILFVFHFNFLQYIKRCIINVGKKKTWK
jgi:hypothetical protein